MQPPAPTAPHEPERHEVTAATAPHGELQRAEEIATPADVPPAGAEVHAAEPLVEAGPGTRGGEAGHLTVSPGCTAPQLRRFIKSRPYVPMHELRRRFGINGAEDDVTPVDTSTGRVYVGLPQREGSLLGELMRGGEVGFELSLDPRTPIVVGLYPMRPIPRS
jgi:hypothetical protein